MKARVTSWERFCHNHAAGRSQKSPSKGQSRKVKLSHLICFPHGRAFPFSFSFLKHMHLNTLLKSFRQVNIYTQKRVCIQCFFIRKRLIECPLGGSTVGVLRTQGWATLPGGPCRPLVEETHNTLESAEEQGLGREVLLWSTWWLGWELGKAPPWRWCLSWDSKCRHYPAKRERGKNSILDKSQRF